jgi:putative heme iron utilization protein
MVEKPEALDAAKQLLNQHRWAALATIDKQGQPHASMVAYALSEGQLLLHLSQLAAHSKHIEDNPQCALVISENEIDDKDPQQLQRISLEGKVEILRRDSESYHTSAEIYQKRLPDSLPLFSFADFALIQFTPVKARFVGGFGKAFSFNQDELSRIV